MTVILVRHGESSGNARGVITGWTDVALTDLGRAQAEAVARRFASAPVDALYASTLSRTVETGRPLASLRGLEIEVIEDLRERCWGESQGLTWPQIRARWDVPTYADLHRVPGMEALEAVRERSWDAMAALLDRHEREVAVCFSHGGTIGQIIAHVLGLPPGEPPGIRVANASVTVIEGASTTPLLTGLNDVCHLGAGPV